VRGRPRVLVSAQADGVATRLVAEGRAGRRPGPVVAPKFFNRTARRLPMACFPRSSTEMGVLADVARLPLHPGTHRVPPGWRQRAGSSVACGDVGEQPHRRLGGHLIGARAHSALSEHSPNLTEPGTCLLRSTVAGRFVQMDVPVTACIRFRAAIYGAQRSARPARNGRPRRVSPVRKRTEV